MKTVKELKALINYYQTDAVFYDYLDKLVAAEVININDEDIDRTAATVSDAFYECMANVYGVELEDGQAPDGEG